MKVKGNFQHFNRHARKFLQNLVPSQPKNSCLRSPHHARLAQVKTDDIRRPSCRLKPDFTLSELFFVLQRTCWWFWQIFCLWLGCGCRWGVKRSSLNAIFDASGSRVWGPWGGGGSAIQGFGLFVQQTTPGLKGRNENSFTWIKVLLFQLILSVKLLVNAEFYKLMNYLMGCSLHFIIHYWSFYCHAWGWFISMLRVTALVNAR